MSVRSTLGVQKSRALLVATAAAVTGLALGACTPNEHPAPADATYETPAVKSGEVVDQNMIRDGQAQVAELQAGRTGTGDAIGSVSFAVVPVPNVGSPNSEQREANADTPAVAVTVTIPQPRDGETLAAGLYSLHVHQNTTCANPGPHLTEDGTDIGALPSISVLENGSGTATTTTQAFTPDQISGKAVVLHDADDEPVACGVIGDPATRAN